MAIKIEEIKIYETCCLEKVYKILQYLRKLTYIISLCSEKVYRSIHCRFGNFRENFIFPNSIKIHISDERNSRLRQDLPISINDRVILPFREGFIFTKLRIRENKVLPKISEFTAYSVLLC